MKNLLLNIASRLLKRLQKNPGIRNLATGILMHFPAIKALLIKIMYRGTVPGLTTLHHQQGIRQARISQQLARKVIQPQPAQTNRPSLAFISPLPPSQTGIASYSAELLHHLAEHFTITLVVQDEKPETLDTFKWITAAQFQESAESYDFKIYQIGNSLHHAWQFQLLSLHPGVVVLHDFYLYDAVWWLEHTGIEKNALSTALYRDHGYPAVLELKQTTTTSRGPEHYPLNRQVIEAATSIICHSRHATQLIQQAYPQLNKQVACIPHLRQVKNKDFSKEDIKKSLGLNAQSLVIASFGGINPKKGILELIKAFLELEITEREVHLILAGAQHTGSYGLSVKQLINQGQAEQKNHKKSLRITGYLSDEEYHAWLKATDIAVQLRTQTRGESSGAVLDTLSYGLPTIVNALGSNAEFPDSLVSKLPEQFTCQQLKQAMQTLIEDQNECQRYSQASTEYLQQHHHPKAVAKAYQDTILNSVNQPQHQFQEWLSKLITNCKPKSPSPTQLNTLAGLIQNWQLDPYLPQPSIYLDITTLAWNDQKTGIERVTRELSRQLLTAPPKGWRVELIRWNGDCFHYANDHAANLLQLTHFTAHNRPIEIQPGDLYLSFEWAPPLIEQAWQEFHRLKLQGLKCCFTVHDLLPLEMPQYFPANADQKMATWLQQIIQLSDGLICVSEHTKNQVKQRLPAPKPLASFHLGADFQTTSNTKLDRKDKKKLQKIQQSAHPKILMVGTLEPRKGHQQTLQALEELWEKDQQITLILVGKQGWQVENLIRSIQNHPQLHRQLHWLNHVSDQLLQQLYYEADLLLAASEGEGFGLPLIEAAQHHLPILARDLPVFREVAGAAADYFTAETSHQLAQTINNWIQNRQITLPPKMHYNTWEDSTKQLLQGLQEMQLLTQAETPNGH